MVDWEKLGKWLDEPALAIQIRRTAPSDDDEEVKQLKAENRELKKLLVGKRVNAIETESRKLIE